MSPKKRQQYILEIKESFKKSGWKEDRWSHLQKEIDGKLHRLKFKKNVLRHEIKSSHGWIKLKSVCFRDLISTMLEVKDD